MKVLGWTLVVIGAAHLVALMAWTYAWVITGWNPSFYDVPTAAGVGAVVALIGLFVGFGILSAEKAKS